MLWGIKTKNSELVNFNEGLSTPVVAQKQSTKQSSQSFKVNRKILTKKSFQQILKQIDFYQPLSKYIDIKKLKNSPNLQTKKYRQCVYFGQVIQNKKQGVGIMLYTNGRIYEGQWRNNHKQGKGYEKFPNSSVYDGEYQKGKPHGYGKYGWENGQVYEGQWEQGLKSGSGIWRGSEGDSYIGQWKNGKAEGYGVHTWINGNRYEGQYKQCLKHGEGIQKFANGDIYKGCYQNGKPHGEGQYYWSDGSSYKGQFKNGLRNGKGIWRKSNQPNSDTYDGQFLDQKKQGYGVFIWSNGSKYIGNFINDVREGYGEMYWSDGTVYKGQWHNGSQVEEIQNTNFDLDFYCISHDLASSSVPDVRNRSKVGELQFKNFEQQFDFQLIEEPHQPQILQLKRFRARQLASRTKTRLHQTSKQKIGEEIMINNNFLLQNASMENNVKSPKKLIKRSSRLSFNGTTNTYFNQEFSRGKIKHSQSTSQKKAMSVCLYNNTKMQNKSSKNIPIKNFQGVELRQDTSQPYSFLDSRCNSRIKQRVTKSSNGMRNISNRHNKNISMFWEDACMNNQSGVGRMDSENESKWFTRSKNQLKYF